MFLLFSAAWAVCPSGVLHIGTDATFPPFASKVGDAYVGYEIELGEAIGQKLGCAVEWHNASFDGIFPALLSGKFDMVLASVTITEERRKTMLFSDPYMDAGQSIVVRKDGDVLENLAALAGHRVGVGLNTTGQYLLEAHPEVQVSKYPSVDLCLSDLRAGRLDAVVGDRPVMAYMVHETFGEMRLVGQPLNSEQWGMVFAPDHEELRVQVNEALAALTADGTRARLEAKFLGVSESAAAPERPTFRLDRLLSSLPFFANGAKWTVILSLGSFVAALPLALLLAVARSVRPLAWLAASWVELLRGTPLLVQVFFIYFVLPGFGISLGDFTTAVLALSLNSSAYISEIFRASLDSIDAGQGEAAAALGMGRLQILRYVLVPQAVRRVVPPLTNEAIALIKESSLVSVMGMTELTRTGQELASRYADPLSIWPGVALCYFLLTFPLSRLSAVLERRFAVGRRRARGL